MVLLESKEDCIALGKHSAEPPRRIASVRIDLRQECRLCHGTGQVEANPTGIVGAQEYIPCPHCSRNPT